MLLTNFKNLSLSTRSQTHNPSTSISRIESEAALNPSPVEKKVHRPIPPLALGALGLSQHGHTIPVPPYCGMITVDPYSHLDTEAPLHVRSLPAPLLCRLRIGPAHGSVTLTSLGVPTLTQPPRSTLCRRPGANRPRSEAR